MNTESAEIKGAAEQPKTIDNVSCRLGCDIAERLGADSTVYISSSGFSLSAFEHLADELEKVNAAVEFKRARGGVSLFSRRRGGVWRW